jgi:hypothetical protein
VGQLLHGDGFLESLSLAETRVATARRTKVVRTFIIGVARCVVELGLRVLTAVGIMRSRSSGYGMQKVGSELER